jgi:ankyrin repeat protein
MAARSGKVILLENVWEWAKMLQLKAEGLRSEVMSKNKSGQTAWHIAARRGYVELLEKIWDFAKELQLKPEELRNEVLWSNKSLDKLPGSWQ